MKLPRIHLILALALAGGLGAVAPTRHQGAGPTDYSSFSRFVSDRNIFDPNRVQRYTSSGRPRPVSRPRTPRSSSAPAFALVGTMSYEKGMFAFFSGNNEDLKKVLPAMEKIAGYTVTEIVPGRVTLESTNQPGKLRLKVGDVMRWENKKWELSGVEDVPTGESSSTTEAASPAAGSSEASAAAAATPAGEPSDVLKRLMEKRAKESQ
jgi:hypothetical protein